MPGCCMSQVPGGSVWDGTRTGPSLDSMLFGMLCSTEHGFMHRSRRVINDKAYYIESPEGVLRWT